MGLFSTTVSSALVSAEHESIKYACFGLLSDSTIDKIQAFFRRIGLPPNPAISPMIVVAILGALVAIVYSIFMKGLKGAWSFLWGLIKVHWMIVIAIIILSTIVIWLILKIGAEAFTDMGAEGFAVVRSSTKTVPPGDPERTTLANIQPVCVKQAGYTGPAEEKGTFKTDVSMMTAIRSGVRMFTLQIDYLETSMPAGFDVPNFPTLIYRDNGGELISTNGASISDIANKLSTYAFNSDFNSHTQPIILYLHFVRSPDPMMDPTKYQTFMTNVATALKPIQDMVLTKADGTDYTKQQAENTLMHTPLSRFEKKILLFTNANTSLLRPLNLPNDKNLDYMVCMRVYLMTTEDQLGTTLLATGSNVANAIIVSYRRIVNMTQSQKSAFAQENIGRFVIVMPKPMESPSQDEIQAIYTTCGVNVVPMNLFGETQPAINPKITSWNGQPFYKLKPDMLQSDKSAVMGYVPPP